MSKQAQKKIIREEPQTCYEQSEAPEEKRDTSVPEASLSDEPVLKKPKTLEDRYTFIRELGSGAQAKVFLAKRLSDGQMTAIKQLRIDSIKNWKEYTLFHREAEVLSTLDIPGVVKLYDAYDSLEEEPPCSYIIQEYVDGPTLKEVLKSGYRFSVSQVYDIILQIIDILEKLHTHEPPVIHRDIKPSNIILRNWNRERFDVCLIDFGAVSNAQVQSGGSTIAGTFGYMAPEQNIGRATPASDTYALAALTAYLLSGVDPADMKTADLRLIIDPYVENHPRALVQTLRQMLEPNMASRLSDLGELKRRFTAFKSGKYENVTSDGEITASNFEERLKEVKYLCQPQNIDIWQSLPNDPAKRPALPDELFRTHPRFDKYMTQGRYDEEFDCFGPIFTIFAIIFTIVITVVFVARLAKHTPLLESSGGLLALILLVTIFFGVCFLIFKLIYDKLVYRTMKGKFGDYNQSVILDSHIVEPEDCPEHIKLYRHGQKTIAMITDITYVPSETTLNITDVKIPRVETPPTYRIWYKFNPPDDSELDDLIHHIDIHHAPAGKFKVGDPLPILYRAAGDDPTVITDSMPFPLPFGDMECNTDYIYRA